LRVGPLIIVRRYTYRRFKDFLARVGALERWYEYKNAAKEKALRRGERDRVE